ncbi:MAG: ZIP family metal transporter [Endomicrobia bacterium]|nr:ZIP family metal transporter [Endomicrobiia bacterium]MCL2506243.1 ZIP family metal transporter [Endomicrobiia bacterium]
MLMAIIYSLMAAVAAMLGAVLVLRFHEKAKKHSFLIINFSAGVMLTIAFVHLIPESMDTNSAASLYVLAGFLIMFFLQFVVLFHPCHNDDCHTHTKIGIAAASGLSFHSLIDGLIIAAGFAAGEGLGILTTLAVLLHRFPDGIMISGILLHSGASKKKIVYFSLLVSLLTPVGTILGIFLFNNISPKVLGALLAAAAGSFIFIAASDLIPETHKCKTRFAPLMIFAGAALMLAAQHLVHTH